MLERLARDKDYNGAYINYFVQHWSLGRVYIFRDGCMYAIHLHCKYTTTKVKKFIGLT